MADDPWGELAPPESASSITARRMDAANKWAFFWGLDHDRRCLLVMRHAVASAPRQQLPLLREVEVRSEVLPDGQPVLVLRLADPSLREIFFQLCRDIAAAAARCETEAEAVDAVVARTWRWYHLLRGGGAGRLRPEEEKGLIGELLVFEHYFIPTLGPAAGVGAWRGPLGEPKDFTHGTVGVESKARGTRDAGIVFVSSEIQLADDGLVQLFLHLSVIDRATLEDPQAFTLPDVVLRVRNALASGGDLVTGRYEALLAAAGYHQEHDYSDSAWSGGERSIYRISGDFPRLTPASVPSGVSSVRYMLSLQHAGSHLTSPSVLRSALIENV